MPEASAARTPCTNCGGTFLWDGAVRKLRCASCDQLRDGPDPGIVLEHDLREMLVRKQRGPALDVRTVRCGACGAEVELGEGVLATRCPFCDSPQVQEVATLGDRVRPESVIPFTTNSAQALAAFKSWLAKRWFRPNDLVAKANVSDLRGVYVPYWTFSAEVTSAWTADAGYNYQETVDGKTVTKTNWKPARGTRHDRIDDELVCASPTLPRGHAHAAASSFTTQDLVAFDVDYLLGFSAENYRIDLPEAWQQGQLAMSSAQERRCARDVPGDTHRNLRASHRFDGVTVKLALLPMWIAAFRYKDGVHQVLVNGQTGKVAGDAPYSWQKILLAVAVAIALIVIAVVIFRR